MLFGDSYIKLKLESCRLKGIVVCVCGMPQSPIVIFDHDGCYYTRCHSCSATMAVSSRAALQAEEPYFDGRGPGVWITFPKSDLFMTFFCMCGYERQFYGCMEELPACDVCRLRYLLPHKLEVRALPPGYGLACSQGGTAGAFEEWRLNSDFPVAARQTVETEPEMVSDLPDVSAKVAAFKKNPYHFLAVTMVVNEQALHDSSEESE
jgi:hypothetical protein